MTPIIGISTYHQNADWRGWSEEGALLPWTYVTSIQDNGGVPVLLPPIGDTAEAEAVIGRLDGVVIAGGMDINPALYDSPAHSKTEAIAPDRDTWELALAEAALKLGLPILGICRGMQIINVASGGTLHQHIPDLVGHAEHEGTPAGFGSHKVRVTAGTTIREAIPGGEFFPVPTHHHQAVNEVGDGLAAVAWAEDGIIEAIEGASPGVFTVGVQWHPEQGDDKRLFRALTAAASQYEMDRAEQANLSFPPSLLAGA
ncbi:MAG TPA: gamma-glutamyl-gamma-aminobutyrate hydrolase family protein [Trebonia sp.]